jgi:hypothetical protein
MSLSDTGYNAIRDVHGATPTRRKNDQPLNPALVFGNSSDAPIQIDFLSVMIHSFRAFVENLRSLAWGQSLNRGQLSCGRVPLLRRFKIPWIDSLHFYRGRMMKLRGNDH